MSTPWSEIEGTLRSADRVVVLTGAGVSAESGVPTFRDKQIGLWEQYDVLDLATPRAFERDPALVWGWYEWRRQIIQHAQPNPAHRALAAWGAQVPGLTLVTQNVDNLHEHGGSDGVLHLHGSLDKPRCARCGKAYAHPKVAVEIRDGGQRIEPPRCDDCGGRVRPGVVWFGEPLPELQWAAAVAAASECEMFFSVGTSSVVQPAASLVEQARRTGAVTVEVNPKPTEGSSLFHFAVAEPAGEALPRLLQFAGRPKEGVRSRD